MERVRLIPRHLQLHTRTMRGRVDSLSWKLPDELSEGEWIEAGIVLGRIGAGLMWWVGDYWIYGEKNYGDRKAIVDDPNWQGPSFQTCANAASVCRAFETSRRREVLSFGHHAEVAALDVKEADRLLDWAQATIATTGKPRSTKDLRREVRQSRIRPGVASSSPTVQAELETKNLKKAKQHRSLAQIEQELIRKDAYIAELEAARDQRPSASAASGIRIATVKQLIDALVVRATGKADSEIAQIVCEITERLNKLQRIRTLRLAKEKAPNAECRYQRPKRKTEGRREEIGRETITHSSRMERSTELPADGKFRMLDRSSMSKRPPNVDLRARHEAADRRRDRPPTPRSWSNKPLFPSARGVDQTTATRPRATRSGGHARLLSMKLRTSRRREVSNARQTVDGRARPARPFRGGGRRAGDRRGGGRRAV